MSVLAGMELREQGPSKTPPRNAAGLDIDLGGEACGQSTRALRPFRAPRGPRPAAALPIRTKRRGGACKLQ